MATNASWRGRYDMEHVKQRTCPSRSTMNWPRYPVDSKRFVASPMVVLDSAGTRMPLAWLATQDKRRGRGEEHRPEHVRVRDTGFEPMLLPWQGSVLPLD